MKKALLASLLTLGLAGSSCLGPDNLYGSLKNWNAEMSDQDWLNEIVYVAFLIVPVYPVALLVDVVALNTIGYWTGEYPVKADPFPGFSSKD
jgi:hypothetical protein